MCNIFPEIFPEILPEILSEILLGFSMKPLKQHSVRGKKPNNIFYYYFFFFFFFFSYFFSFFYFISFHFVCVFGMEQKSAAGFLVNTISRFFRDSLWSLGFVFQDSWRFSNHFRILGILLGYSINSFMQ